MANISKIYYQPEEGFCGDFIPFYWRGTYHLFYIKGSNWNKVITTDFVNFQEHGIMLPSGGKDAQDQLIYTGCVVEKDGKFYIFYTGHNPDYPKTKGKPQQVLLLAISDDLEHWVKQPDFMIPPDKSRFELGGWRDPYVFYNDEKGEYWMIITGNTKEDFAMRWKGCTILLTSDDMLHWDIKGPLYAPNLYDSHECPDMFKIGDKWYLIFSTYSRWWETRYRIADTCEGPWEIPTDDIVDGRDYYAAKTVSNGTDRYLIGWAARREDNDDKKSYLWGGNLAVHKVVQNADKTLGFAPVKMIEDAFTKPVLIEPIKFLGEWKFHDDKISCESPYKYSFIKLGTTGESCLLKATIQFKSKTNAAGILFRSDMPSRGKFSTLRIEPMKSKILFDHSAKYFRDVFAEEERLITVDNNRVELEIIAHGSVIVFYLNGKTALTVRSYELTEGDFGLFVEGGSAEFTDIVALEMKE